MARAVPDIYRILFVEDQHMVVERLLTKEQLRMSLSEERCCALTPGQFIFGMVVESEKWSHHMLTRGCKPLLEDTLNSFVTGLSTIENLDYKNDYALIQSEYFELYYDMQSP